MQFQEFITSCAGNTALLMTGAALLGLLLGWLLRNLKVGRLKRQIADLRSQYKDVDFTIRQYNGIISSLKADNEKLSQDVGTIQTVPVAVDVEYLPWYDTPISLLVRGKRIPANATIVTRVAPNEEAEVVATEVEAEVGVVG